jgi:hypothetical protein
MATLVNPASLVLEPNPGPAPGVSRERARARALRAWQRGESELVVTYRGMPVEPAQVLWDAVDTGSGSSGPAPAGRVALSAEASARLDDLAERWGCTRAEAASRAIIFAAAQP